MQFNSSDLDPHALNNAYEALNKGSDAPTPPPGAPPRDPAAADEAQPTEPANPPSLAAALSDAANPQSPATTSAADTDTVDPHQPAPPVAADSDSSGAPRPAASARHAQPGAAPAQFSAQQPPVNFAPPQYPPASPQGGFAPPPGTFSTQAPNPAPPLFAPPRPGNGQQLSRPFPEPPRPAVSPTRPTENNRQPAADPRTPPSAGRLRASSPRPPQPLPLPSNHSDRSFTQRNLRREGPQQGWRAALHRMHIPIGKSSVEVEHDLDISKINKIIRYPKIIGFAAPKGGVGKTVCAMGIASTISEHRQHGDVAAIDTDHSGSLASRVRGDQVSDIKRFVLDEALQSINDVKAHMQSNIHRLSVLGSSRSPLASALEPNEYQRALECLQTGYLFTVVDMDASAASPAYETIVRSLDALVVVTATAIDSAEATDHMVKWVRAHDLSELLTRTIVLINHQSPAKPHLDLDATVSHFQNNEKLPVLEIPWDEHLAEAGPINLDLLNKTTRRQFVKVAAWLIDQLPAT